jgi:DNA modification methylase
MSDHSSNPELAVSYRPINTLRPNSRNPRTHTKKQVAQLAASYEEFGWTVPILLDAEDRVIAGHGRLEAAKLLALDEVPTICLDHLTAVQARAYALADNRLAELAGWDDELLALELGELAELDLDFDITITGFEMPEIDLLIQESQESTDPADDIPDIESDVPPVTSAGDLWELGPHCIHCADATREDSYERLMGDERAEFVFADPPYNVRMRGHATGLGRTEHREFLMASGEMTSPQFTGFLMTIFESLTRWSLEGSIHQICMDWRHQLELLTAARRTYGAPINMAVWVKTNGGLGRHGRNRTNVWTYPGVNTFRAGRDDELAMHPTVKPVEMVADALLDCSNRGGIVLDCFGGSGTTLIAAEKTGRRARLIELDPLYVDVTLRRYEALTGEDAVHVQSGRTFSALEAQRDGAGAPSESAADKEVHDV